MKTIRLITTGAEPYQAMLDSHDMNVCLGDWCHNWISANQNIMPVSVLPHPWVNNDRYESDYRLIMKLYDDLSVTLAHCLSDELNAPNSVRYWQILLGPWLSRFLTLVFEHDVLISEVLDRYEGDRINYLQPKATTNFVASTSMEANQFLESREFNAVIYANLLSIRSETNLESTGDYAFDEVPPNNSTKVTISQYFKLFLKKCIYIISGKILKCFELKRVYIASRLSLLERLKISSATKSLSFFSLPIDTKSFDCDVDLHRRRNLAVIATGMSAPCHHHIVDMVFDYLPKSFLEGYDLYDNRAKCKTKSIVKTIINGIGDYLLDSEVSRFWIAYQVDNGAKLVTRQHGGVYGSSKFMMVGDLQIKNADIFVSWGWQGFGVKPISLTPARRRIKANLGSSRITIVMVAYPMFFYHMFPSPQSAKFLSYIEMIKTLSFELKDKFSISPMLRRYPTDFGWHVDELFKDLDIQITSSPDTTLQQNLRNSSLVIVTYDSTSHIESILSNFPTVLLFSPEFVVLSEEAIPVFEKLKAVGICHESIESLNQFLLDILPDIELWWGSDKTQNALVDFKYYFAHESPDSPQEWRKLLEDLESEN